MKKNFLALAALATLAISGASVAHADDMYGGVGLPGLYTIGYTHNLNNSVNIRGDFAGGVNVSADGSYEGVNATATIKSNTVGLYGDWFPISNSGFRLVGGVTFNDTRAEINANGTGTATINGNTVNMAGDYYRVKVALPDVTPYLGIGYGHQKLNQSGIGFYADLGVMIGDFTVKSDTSLVASGKVSQADINAQDAKIRDSVNKLGVMPVVSLGIVYRF